MVNGSKLVIPTYILKSNLYPSNNNGFASKLNYKSQYIINESKLKAFIDLKYIEKTFQPIERIFDVEFNRDWDFNKNLLNEAYLKAKSSYDMEHVTPWIYKNYFKKKNNISLIKENFSKLRITLDFINDYLYFVTNFKILKKISISRNFVKLLKNLNKIK